MYREGRKVFVNATVLLFYNKTTQASVGGDRVTLLCTSDEVQGQGAV